MAAMQNDFGSYAYLVEFRHGYQHDSRYMDFITWLRSDEAKGYYRWLPGGIGRCVVAFEDHRTAIAAKLLFH